MGDDAPRAVIARLKAAAAGDARAFESMTVRRDGERRATTTRTRLNECVHSRGFFGARRLD